MRHAPPASAASADFRPFPQADVIHQDSRENGPGPQRGPGTIPGNRLEQKKQGKVAAIFKAAQDLFLAQGYHAATVDQIAHLAGVSVGSVYVYFKSKERLCLALLDKALEAQERYLLEAIDPAEDPITTLRRLGRAYLRFFLDHPRFFRLLMFLEHGGIDHGSSDNGGSDHGRSDNGGSDHGTRGVEISLETYDRRTERLLQVLSSQIIEGIHRGIFREVDPARAARFLWGSWTGVIGLTNHTGPTGVRIEDLPRTLELGADMVLGGLLRCADRGD